MVFVGLPGYALPKTNVGIENRPKPKGKDRSPSTIFQGLLMLVLRSAIFYFLRHPS